MNKEVRNLIKRLEAIPGVRVDRNRAHPRVMRDGNFIMALAATPSDSRWEKNTIARLKEKGIDLRAEQVRVRSAGGQSPPPLPPIGGTVSVQPYTGASSLEDGVARVVSLLASVYKLNTRDFHHGDDLDRLTPYGTVPRATAIIEAFWDTRPENYVVDNHLTLGANFKLKQIADIVIRAYQERRLDNAKMASTRSKGKILLDAIEWWEQGGAPLDPWDLVYGDKPKADDIDADLNETADIDPVAEAAQAWIGGASTTAGNGVSVTFTPTPTYEASIDVRIIEAVAKSGAGAWLVGQTLERLGWTRA